jgi:hypothetical protein
MTGAHYTVSEVTVAPRLVAGVRAVVKRGQVGAAFRPHLDQIYAAAKAGAVSLDGQNIFMYPAATEHELTVDFCVGVKAHGCRQRDAVETPAASRDDDASRRLVVWLPQRLPCVAGAATTARMPAQVRTLGSRSVEADHRHLLPVGVFGVVRSQAFSAESVTELCF